MLFTHSQSHRWLDLNPQTWVHELSVLPVCYHFLSQSLLAISSLPEPSATGFEPTNLGLRVECSTTVLPLFKSVTFLLLYHCQCWWWLDLNPQTWVHELSVPPLCYHFLSQSLLAIYSLPEPSVAGFEPSNLGSWVECSTNVLTLFKSVTSCDFLTPGAIGGWIWTPANLGLWVECYTTVLPLFKSFTYFAIFSHPEPAMAAFEPSNLGSWGECSTTVPPLFKSVNFYYFITPRASRGWIWTCKLRFMSRVFYLCVTTL